MRLLLVVLGLLPLTAAPARAQEAAAGASYTFVSLTYPDQIPNGFGGWLTWRFLDIGANFFPEDHPVIGRQTQVRAGARAGIRLGRVAAFARVRPGFVHFTERFLAPDIGCVALFPPPEACLIDATNFALDIGGTVEVSPSARTVIRVDIGDTLIRFNRSELDPAWRNNLQIAAGGGVRF
jgi:hypothetical protein